MANVNCNACEEIRQDSPNLIVNGLGDTECTSLKNNTGLNPSSGNDDCEDLNNLNDCLVGNMEAEVDAYDVCDWKPFMKKFIPNVWTTIKAVICALCGLWDNMANILTNINNLNDKIDNIEVDTSRVDCLIQWMSEGFEFLIGETATTSSYIVAGQGVSFVNAGTEEFSHEVNMEYIAGGLMRLYGSCRFYTSSFTDEKACWHFDNNSETPVYGTSRAGSSRWGDAGKPAVAGDLVYEVRILKSQYPQIKEFIEGFGMGHSGGSFNAHVRVFDEGQWAYGTHGHCSTQDGSPADSGYSHGHRVEPGWVYVQQRIDYLDMGMNSGSRYSPYSFFGVRLNADEIEC